MHAQCTVQDLRSLLHTHNLLHAKPLYLQNAVFIISQFTLFQKKHIPLPASDSSPACSLILEDLCLLNARASIRHPPLLSSFTCLLTAGMEKGRAIIGGADEACQQNTKTVMDGAWPSPLMLTC